MKVNIANQYQSVLSVSSATDYRSAVSSAQGIGSGIQLVGNATVQEQTQAITSSVSSLQQQLYNLNIVDFPPFFPIARYQKMDLILNIKKIQEQINRSSLSPDLKQAVSATALKNNSTDEQIGTALDTLYSVRDSLVNGRL
jgi:hypothetical protein